MHIVWQFSNHLRSFSRPNEEKDTNRVLRNTHYTMTQNMVIAWMQAGVWFPHMFIGIEDTSVFEQIPQTIDSCDSSVLSI
jgi:hypothetical protein